MSLFKWIPGSIHVQTDCPAVHGRSNEGETYATPESIINASTNGVPSLPRTLTHFQILFFYSANLLHRLTAGKDQFGHRALRTFMNAWHLYLGHVEEGKNGIQLVFV